MRITHDKPIIFFDGVCNLCNTSVQFIIKRDKNNHFLFSSLQSDAAKDILLQYTIENNELNSIILLEEGVLYQKSTAILKIAKKLSGPAKLAYSFIIIPKFVRDAVYAFIARHRYTWFGKKDSCMIPSEEYKLRFLE